MIRPEVTVCLGLTAARSVFNRGLRLKDYRGRFRASALCSMTYVTAHPSAVLRMRTVDESEYEQEYRRLVEDLEAVANRIRDRQPVPAGGCDPLSEQTTPAVLR